MYQTIYTRLFIIISSLLVSATAFGDHYPYNHHSYVRAGIDFEQIYINPEVADRELVGDTATAINLGFDFGNPPRRTPYIDFGLGLSLVFFRDEGAFTQETVDQHGHIFNARSDAEALHIYLEGGPNIPISRYTNIHLKGGYTLPISSERSIDNCSACFSEDIDIDAGAYGQFGLSHKVGDISLKSEYKFYLDSDNGIEDSFSFGLYAGY